VDATGKRHEQRQRKERREERRGEERRGEERRGEERDRHADAWAHSDRENTQQ
jgi:hypothetical protein